jgi:hypothetical protein
MGIGYKDRKIEIVREGWEDLSLDTSTISKASF